MSFFGFGKKEVAPPKTGFELFEQSFSELKKNYPGDIHIQQADDWYKAMREKIDTTPYVTNLTNANGPQLAGLGLAEIQRRIDAITEKKEGLDNVCRYLHEASYKVKRNIEKMLENPEKFGISKDKKKLSKLSGLRDDIYTSYTEIDERCRMTRLDLQKVINKYIARKNELLRMARNRPANASVAVSVTANANRRANGSGSATANTVATAPTAMGGRRKNRKTRKANKKSRKTRRNRRS